MHTSAFKSCRIHHNGGYDGDIIITNRDSTSKPIGPLAEVETTFENIVKMVLSLSSGRRTVIVPCVEKKEPDYENYPGFVRKVVIEEPDINEKEIKVLVSDLKALIADSLIDKITCKLESIDTEKYGKKLIKIARILGIKK